MDALRYVQCELPESVTQALINFQSDFEELALSYNQQFDEFRLVTLPIPLAQLDEVIAATEALLTGSPVPELNSFAALEENLALPDPTRGPRDPVAIRQDERAMGAGGICMLNGRTFQILAGTRIEALRTLWNAVGGDYNAFIMAGDGIVNSPVGSFVLYEFNTATQNVPYINRDMSELPKLSGGYKPSIFDYRLFWNTSISTTSGSHNKLAEIGYTADEISAIFSGGQPTANYDSSGALTSVETNLLSLSHILLLPLISPLRKPRWANEVKYIQTAIQSFLDWRIHDGMTSYVIDPAFWVEVKANLFPEDMKELFEYRPEISDLAIPTADAVMDKLITKATASLSNTTLLNTYMLSLPKPKQSSDLETSLFNVGLEMWQELRIDYTTYANSLESLLLELDGRIKPLTPFDRAPTAANLNLADLKKVVNQKTTNALTEQPGMTTNPETAPEQNKVPHPINMPPPAVMSATMKSTIDLSDHPNLSSLCLTAAVNSGKFSKTGTTSGVAQGFKSCQSMGSIMGAKIDWSKNSMSCSGTTSAKNSFGQKTQSTSTPNAIWRPVTANNPGTTDTTTVKYKNTLGQKPHSKSTTVANTPNAYSAADRTTIQYNQGAPPNTVAATFNITCVPKIENAFTKYLAAAEGKFRKSIIHILNMLKAVIIIAQNFIDGIIIKIQLLLDMWISKLQKYMTVNIAIGGNLGFDTGLIKCSWGMDFKLKIDLLGYLLGLLSEYLRKWQSPVFALQAMIKKFLQSVICPVVRMIESLVGAANKLLNVIGCSVKDINFPKEFLDLLGLALGSFNLRQLVLRGATDKIGDIALSLRKNKDQFNGLQQFAAFCQRTPPSDVVNTMSNFMSSSTSDLPLAGGNAWAGADTAAGATMLA